jgi:hypothetical protein
MPPPAFGTTIYCCYVAKVDTTKANVCCKSCNNIQASARQRDRFPAAMAANDNVASIRFLSSLAALIQSRKEVVLLMRGKNGSLLVWSATMNGKGTVRLPMNSCHNHCLLNCIIIVHDQYSHQAKIDFSLKWRIRGERCDMHH